MNITKIVSGGQTGVDQAGLDYAIEADIPYGGWLPRGRKTEAGPLPQTYRGMHCTSSRAYPDRTRRNIRDSDVTLILTWGPPTGGTKLAVESAVQMQKPALVIDLRGFDSGIASARSWLRGRPDGILNVAGPRQSKFENIDIHRLALSFLRQLALHSKP